MKTKLGFHTESNFLFWYDTEIAIRHTGSQSIFDWAFCGQACLVFFQISLPNRRAEKKNRKKHLIRIRRSRSHARCSNILAAT